MKFSDYPDYVRSVAYALELILSEAMDDDEIEKAMQDIANQWIYTPDHALSIRDDWQRVLHEQDYDLAQYLVRDWARQGDMSPIQAYSQLQKWYDRLARFWLSLSVKTIR